MRQRISNRHTKVGFEDINEQLHGTIPAFITHIYLFGIAPFVFVTFYLSLLLSQTRIMPSDGHSTVWDAEKVDDCDYDKDGPDVVEEPMNFPEGGTRAWMAVVGRFDFRNRSLAEFDEGL